MISARIVPDDSGAVAEIHVLTSADSPPKQTVRNIESALLAHLGMRVDHRKVSVATTNESKPAAQGKTEVRGPGRRELYFEDVEVRGSRTKGTMCRVTLRRGNQSYVGESEGVESDRSRLELAGRATLNAIGLAYGGARKLGLEGIKVIGVFDRTIVMAAVTVQVGRDTMMLTGTCEVRESAETAGALAVLDAINRWIEFDR
ncbi:hypothetical protein BH23GEM2_BH23GEM2_03150 [soil metagenome]